MATDKQRAAARKNIKKASAAAKEKRTIAHLPKATRTALTNALFRPAGTLPRGVLELDHIDAAKKMVLAGLGIALLPTTAVSSELLDGTLRRIELIGTPPIERRIVGVRRVDEEHRTEAGRAFWGLLEAFGAERGAGIESGNCGGDRDGGRPTTIPR